MQHPSPPPVQHRRRGIRVLAAQAHLGPVEHRHPAHDGGELPQAHPVDFARPEPRRAALGIEAAAAEAELAARKGAQAPLGSPAAGAPAASSSAAPTKEASTTW